MAEKSGNAITIIFAILSLAFIIASIVVPVPVYARHMLAEMRSINSMTADNAVYPRVALNFMLMSLASAIVAILFGGYSISDTKKGAERLLNFAIIGAFMSFFADLFLLWLSPFFWASLWINGNRSLLSAMFRPETWLSLWLILIIGCTPVLLMYFFLTRLILQTKWSSSVLIAAVITIITFIGWILVNPALVQIPPSGEYRLIGDESRVTPSCIDSEGNTALYVLDIGGWNDWLFFNLRYDGPRAFLSSRDWRSIIISGTTLDFPSGETVFDEWSPLLNETRYDGIEWSGLACQSMLDESSDESLRRGEDLSVVCSGMLPQQLAKDLMSTYWNASKGFSLSVSLSNCKVSTTGRWIAAAD